jgi:hypothetical protein
MEKAIPPYLALFGFPCFFSLSHPFDDFTG